MKRKSLLKISLSLMIIFLFVCSYGKGNYKGAGRCNSIIIDSLNKPGIAYYDDNTNSVMYATRIEGVWKVELVNTEKIVPPAEYSGFVTCELFRLKIDNKNNPFLLYFNSLENTYKFARKVAGEWELYTIPVVDAEKVVEFDNENVWLFNLENGSIRRFNIVSQQSMELPSIPDFGNTPYNIFPAFTIDKYYNNRVHVIYQNNKGSLVYTFFETDNWNAPEEIYGEGSVIPCAITVDSSGGVHILFEVNNTKNLYGFRDGTGWHLEEIPWYLSKIAGFQLDIFNVPVILYISRNKECYPDNVYDEYLSCYEEIAFIEKYNGMWRTIEWPLQKGSFFYPSNSFTINNENNIHLSFVEVSVAESTYRCGQFHVSNLYSNLKYAFYNRNNWTMETIY